VSLAGKRIPKRSSSEPRQVKKAMDASHRSLQHFEKAGCKVGTEKMIEQAKKCSRGFARESAS
jgi:hypothetical protein